MVGEAYSQRQEELSCEYVCEWYWICSSLDRRDCTRNPQSVEVPGLNGSQAWNWTGWQLFYNASELCDGNNFRAYEPQSPPDGLRLSEQQVWICHLDTSSVRFWHCNAVGSYRDKSTWQPPKQPFVSDLWPWLMDEPCGYWTIHTNCPHASHKNSWWDLL